MRFGFSGFRTAARDVAGIVSDLLMCRDHLRSSRPLDVASLIIPACRAQQATPVVADPFRIDCVSASRSMVERSPVEAHRRRDSSTCPPSRGSGRDRRRVGTVTRCFRASVELRDDVAATATPPRPARTGHICVLVALGQVIRDPRHDGAKEDAQTEDTFRSMNPHAASVATLWCTTGGVTRTNR